MTVSCGLLFCGPSDFDPQSKIAGVRILASQADKPYAKPGDTVHLDVLTVDGRTDKSKPLTLYWIPLVCENPTNDAYYGCFAPPSGDAGASDGGGMEGGLALLRPGVDLTPFLKTGPTFDFTMPADAITAHKVTPGLDAPYGLAILFNVACAGHLEITDTNPATGQQQVPIGCFDDDKNQVDPSQYVIGYTRVYAYTDRTNANPVIDHVTYQGDTVDVAKGVDMERCKTEKRSDCPEVTFDVVVPEDSWELNPSDKDPDGTIRHEQIWAAYYASVGQLEGDARLLYDPARGKIDGSEVKYQAPNEAGEGTVWIVVHDNRGGANWAVVPIRVH
jgi:hypothetical protein